MPSSFTARWTAVRGRCRYAFATASGKASAAATWRPVRRRSLTQAVRTSAARRRSRRSALTACSVSDGSAAVTTSSLADLRPGRGDRRRPRGRYRRGSRPAGSPDRSPRPRRVQRSRRRAEEDACCVSARLPSQRRSAIAADSNVTVRGRFGITEERCGVERVTAEAGDGGRDPAVIDRLPVGGQGGRRRVTQQEGRCRGIPRVGVVGRTDAWGTRRRSERFRGRTRDGELTHPVTAASSAGRPCRRHRPTTPSSACPTASRAPREVAGETHVRGLVGVDEDDGAGHLVPG